MKKSSSRQELYRDGNLLVIREGTRFPNRCAICNVACEEDPVAFTFQRQKAHYVEVAALQCVVNAAGDLLKGARYTGPVRASIPLCKWHRLRRLRWLGIGLALSVLAIGFLLIERALGWVIVPPGELGFLNISLPNFIAFALAFVGIGITVAAAFDGSNFWFKATKFYDRFVWVNGVGRTFLAELPPLKDHQVDPQATSSELSAEELIRRAKRSTR